MGPVEAWLDDSSWSVTDTKLFWLLLPLAIRALSRALSRKPRVTASGQRLYAVRSVLGIPPAREVVVKPILDVMSALCGASAHVAGMAAGIGAIHKTREEALIAHRRALGGLLIVTLVSALHWIAWLRIARHAPVAVPSRPVAHLPAIVRVRIAPPLPQVLGRGEPRQASADSRRADTRIHVPPAGIGSRVAAHAHMSAAPDRPGVQPAIVLPPPTLYAAHVPASARLTYHVERGGRPIGEASLDWRHQADRYSLNLLVALPDDGGGRLLEQTSVGRLTDHGLQPERFVDHRRHRGERAVNMQCLAGDVGGVSFSASTAQRDCVPGMQDSASWWVQLAAIVAALPTLPDPGTELRLFVARTHGTVDLWTFIVQGRQGWDASADRSLPASAIKLVRRPNAGGPFYDTTAEVWLDAAPPHWPLRVTLQEARGEPLTWTRTQAQGMN